MKVWKIFWINGSRSLKVGLAIATFCLIWIPSGGLILAAPLPAPILNFEWFMTQHNAPSVPPPVLEKIRQDLARRTGESGDRFQVKTATPQTWPDGCLGLAQPMEMCTQALVEGWRVVMSREGTGRDRQEWIYRSNGRGTVLRLERSP